MGQRKFDFEGSRRTKQRPTCQDSEEEETDSQPDADCSERKGDFYLGDTEHHQQSGVLAMMEHRNIAKRFDSTLIEGEGLELKVESFKMGLSLKIIKQSKQ